MRYKYISEVIENPNLVEDFIIDIKTDLDSIQYLVNTPNLKELSITGANSSEVSNIISKLGFLPLLREIWFFECSFKKLPIIVQDNKNISSLIFSECLNIDMSELFYDLNKVLNLVELDLSDMGLIDVHPSISLLSNLKELYLDGNLLTDISLEIRRLPNLEVLFYFDNQIKELHFEKQDLKSLKRLDLCYNQIEEVPVGAFQLDSLKWLRMWYNPLIYFPKIKKMNYVLESLNIEHGNLNKIPKSIRKMKVLTLLDISSHNITNSAFKSILKLRKLKRLDISSTNIDVIPKRIGVLKDMENLTLSYLPIETLPLSMSKMNNLNQIGLGELTQADWKSIISILASIKSLRRVGMFSMGIQFMPDNFSELDFIEVFWMSFNRFNTNEQIRIRKMAPNSKINFR